jgi:hypothetical protein
METQNTQKEVLEMEEEIEDLERDIDVSGIMLEEKRDELIELKINLLNYLKKKLNIEVDE